MWTPKTIEARKQSLDLTGSGQDTRAVTQLIFDGHIVFNASEFVDWSQEPLQIFLCEACLHPGCGGGGCVVVRKLSNRVVIMPALLAQSAGEWERTEYAPPLSILKHGSFLLNYNQWKTVCELCPDAPKTEALTAITPSELAMLYHYQAPRTFLPDSLHPETANWDLILTSNGPDTATDVDHLKLLFVQPSRFTDYEIATTVPDSYTISVFLDTSDIYEWPVFSSGNERWAYIAPDLHVKFFQKTVKT